MTLEPRKVKYRTRFRGRLRGKAHRGSSVEFGEYGLKAQTAGLISAAQIEAARKVIRGHTKRGGKLWIRIFPDKPMTKKPAEVRMGMGKGPFSHWSAKVKPGRILFEVAGIEEKLARESFRLAAHKLSIRSRFVTA